MCEHEVLSSTVREWTCYTLEHKLDQNEPFVNRKVLAPKSYGSETLFAETVFENNLDANVSREQETMWTESSAFLALPPRQGFPPAASNMPSEQDMFLVY